MKDRNPKYPGRIKLTKVSGTTDTWDMTMADEPLENGTPPTKANLLTDATSKNVSNDEIDHTVNEILNLSIGCVGDIKSSLRTSLGSQWALCNGDNIKASEHPDLANVIKKTVSPLEKIAQDTSGFSGVATGDGYVVGTDGTNVFYKKILSNDTWHTASVTSPASYRLFSRVAFLNGYFIVYCEGLGTNISVGNGDCTLYYCLSSNLAGTWSSSDPTSGSAYCHIVKIDFRSGKYFVGFLYKAYTQSDPIMFYIVSSSDLSTWSSFGALSYNPNLDSISYDSVNSFGFSFFICSSYIVYSSANSTTAYYKDISDAAATPISISSSNSSYYTEFYSILMNRESAKKANSNYFEVSSDSKLYRIPTSISLLLSKGLSYYNVCDGKDIVYDGTYYFYLNSDKLYVLDSSFNKQTQFGSGSAPCTIIYYDETNKKIYGIRSTNRTEYLSWDILIDTITLPTISISNCYTYIRTDK